MAGKKPPREFGGRSPDGLADLRALHGIDVPFLQTIRPGVRAYKRNGFDEVAKDPEEAPQTGRWFSNGLIFDQPFSVSVGRALELPFAPRESAFLATDFLHSSDARNALLTFNTDSTAPSGYSRGLLRQSRDLLQFTDPVTFNIPRLASDPNFSSRLPKSQLTDGVFARSPAEQYAVFGTSMYDLSTEVVQHKLMYFDDGAWQAAASNHQTQFDHFAGNITVLGPEQVLAVSAVVPIFHARWFSSISRANETPLDVAIPFPVFQLSTDRGRTYEVVDLDYLFADDAAQWGSLETPGGLGFSYGEEVALSFTAMQTEAAGVVVAFVVWTPSLGSALRYFRGASLETLSAATPPPVDTANDFPGLVGRNAVYRFADVGIDWRTNSVIYYCSAHSFDEPPHLYVSTDGGSWVDRQLPWLSLNVGRPVWREDYGICVSVFEELLSPEDPVSAVSVYRSSDLGATWQRLTVLARDVPAPTETSYYSLGIRYTYGLKDFEAVTLVEPDPQLRGREFRYDARRRPQ